MSQTVWLLVAVLVAAIVMVSLMQRTGGPKRRFRAGGLARSRLTERQRELVVMEWTQVHQLLELARPSSLTAAIVEADKLLDLTLKQLGASGQTLGERLQSAESKLSDYDGTWQAHKLRNRIVHESDYDPRPAEVKRALVQFERALKDLGAL